MDRKNRILVADDEKEIRDLLQLLLTAEGYDVVLADSGQAAVDLADSTIDMYILDVNMPEMSGFVAGSIIRKTYLAPMIFLTAYMGDSDKAMGFAVGADDYIVKPFSNSELLLRIKSLFRRVQQYQPKMTAASGDTEVKRVFIEDLEIDLEHEAVRKGDEQINLTHTEFKILELFALHRKKIYSLENIYQSIWGDNAIGDSTIMVHIKNLRKKIGDSTKNPKYIKTAWGKGYYVD